MSSVKAVVSKLDFSVRPLCLCGEWLLSVNSPQRTQRLHREDLKLRPYLSGRRRELDLNSKAYRILSTNRHWTLDVGFWTVLSRATEIRTQLRWRGLAQQRAFGFPFHGAAELDEETR